MHQRTLTLGSCIIAENEISDTFNKGRLINEKEILNRRDFTINTIIQL